MAEKQPSKNFLLRLDRASMEALERWAADEFRSVNGQLQWIVADAHPVSDRMSVLVPTAATEPQTVTKRAERAQQSEERHAPQQLALA